MIDALKGAREMRPAVKKISTVAKSGNKIFKEPKLTIGLDLGDRTSHYCILDEAGNVILEHSFPTTPKGILQVFSRIPRSRLLIPSDKRSANRTSARWLPQTSVLGSYECLCVVLGRLTD
jgi:hypothetical protein